jgi:hypothetical protein
VSLPCLRRLALPLVGIVHSVDDLADRVHAGVYVRFQQSTSRSRRVLRVPRC